MFDALEIGRFTGRKVALYRFTLGTAEWLFTSNTKSIERGGKTYLRADGISHSALREASGGGQKNQVTLTLPYRLDASAANLPDTQPLGDVFWPHAPTGTVLVAIASTHVGDPDEQVAVEWLGRVVAPSLTGVRMELVCDASYRTGAAARIRRIGRACDVALYSQGVGMCNLSKEDFAIEATLSGVDGLTLSAAAFGTAPRNLAGGFIQWTRTNGLLERRSIWTHVGSSIRVNYGGAELAAALTLMAYPGCAHNFAACTAYGNQANYPGWRDLPTNEPMSRSQQW